MRIKELLHKLLIFIYFPNSTDALKKLGQEVGVPLNLTVDFVHLLGLGRKNWIAIKCAIKGNAF